MKKQLPNFSGLRIVVVGDVMIDRYLSGQVDRISPEAPVPVVHLQEEENRLGGAANVVLNLQALGATALPASVIGQDAHAEVFMALLQALQIPTAGIVKSPHRRTTVKTRVIAQNQQLLRADREDTHELSDTETQQLLQAIDQLLAQGPVDMLLLQDYNKGVLNPATIEALLQKAAAHQIPVAVDPKKHNFWAYASATLFKPNLREIQAQLDFPIRPMLADLDQADTEIRSRLQHRFTMITLAEHGVYINDGASSAIYPTQKRHIADVSGAGDTVISVAACALASGMPLAEIAQLANLAGGQVIEKPGVVAVELEQLRREYEGI